MNPIKMYTAIKLSTRTVDDTVEPKLTYGEINGPYYSREYPSESFTTEEEAIDYAYKTDKCAKWLILPVVTFDNY